jgi:tetratricopeptide (TPR) repeat protein
MVTKFVTGDTIRPAGRVVLTTLRQQLGLTQTETDAIEAEVFRPHQERLANLQIYRDALFAEADHEYPLGHDAREALKTLQQLLGLRVADLASIEKDISGQFAQRIKQPEAESTTPETSQPPKSESVFARIAKPFTANKCFNSGLKKRNAGDYKGAIADYTEAIRLKSDYADAYNNRGAAKSDLGDKQGAIKDYNEAIRLKSDYANSYYGRGLIKSALSDKQGALKDFQEAARLYQHQGNTEWYNNALKRIEELEQ